MVKWIVRFCYWVIRLLEKRPSKTQFLALPERLQQMLLEEAVIRKVITSNEMCYILLTRDGVPDIPDGSEYSFTEGGRPTSEILARKEIESQKYSDLIDKLQGFFESGVWTEPYVASPTTVITRVVTQTERVPPLSGSKAKEQLQAIPHRIEFEKRHRQSLNPGVE